LAHGTIWNFDAFDQWGIEPGKALARRITPELESRAEPELGRDRSMNNSIRFYGKLEETPR
jgi:glucose-6-phosphate isomerase